ncbi:MAG: D-alanyl-D-alanine carboxypeptidase [Lacunisphaera sp.]|jgi:D-alanyl-D-alanine carboxypeptidase|nr:D-alanyl-D-alanine carboxypeptidase [Lacunisphaera sp.]
MPSFRPLPALVLLWFTCFAGSLAAKEARPAYLGAIVIDAADGRVLFDDRADTVSPPASMTKLMTFAVVHDKLASGALTPEAPVTVTAEDSRIGGTQVWLKQGEVFPVDDLLYAMMIQSGNDTAHALARAAGGSPAAFVELMNAKARELGLAHTTFRTPHGLPPANRRTADGDLTTPRDFATLSRWLLQHTDVTKYSGVRQRKFGEGRRAADRVIAMTNHNHLLGKVAGVDGLKTGFTNGAGYCLAATAERGGRRVIVVVMGSPDSKTRDLKVMELLERGFASAPAVLPAAPRPALPAPSAVAQPGGMPTVKTDKSPPPASAGETSTAAEPALTFRVIPPTKKP